jgi:threonine dehydratase
MFQRIQDAADRLRGIAHVTPVLSSDAVSRMVGVEVFFKCENFQRIGAFKFRGAYNAVSRLSEDQRKRGVLTFSSGNHAQAIALAGKLLGVSTTVVMPRDAPVIKRAATEGYGARVIDYDARTDSREKIAEDLTRTHGYTLVPPFDHLDVIAGQGTAALEFFRQAGPFDLLLVPCGGGGLLSGCAAASKGLDPRCRVIGIEPEMADDAARSFRTGALCSVHNPQTIADGTRTPSLGRITFPMIQELVDDLQTVSETAIAEAVRIFFHRMKIVVEPSGALGLAALLDGAFKGAGRVGVVISGGNIDGEMMSRILRCEL